MHSSPQRQQTKNWKDDKLIFSWINEKIVLLKEKKSFADLVEEMRSFQQTIVLFSKSIAA